MLYAGVYLGAYLNSDPVAHCSVAADNGRIQCKVMRLQVLCFMIKTISYVSVSARADNKAAHVLTGLRPP